MKIKFYYRHPDKLNRSIERVFEAVATGLEKEQGITVSNFFAKTYKFWPLGILANTLSLGFKGWSPGVNHITGDIHYISLLMPRSRTILTIHDLVSLHNPTLNPLVKRLVYYLWYYLPLRRLKYVTCISEATKADLIKFFPFAEGKITVIPNPVSARFTEMERVDNSKPVILHLGTRSNKNLERVIEALSGLRCHLRIIGKLTERQSEQLRASGIEWSNADSLSDEEILQEYKKCDIVSFPSLFEGFGMPVIEGQASGRAVVTSDIEPMRSIAGDGAVLVDPTDIHSIRRGFESVINDDKLRRRCIAAGLKNSGNYTEKNISNLYKRLYDKVL